MKINSNLMDTQRVIKFLTRFSIVIFAITFCACKKNTILSARQREQREMELLHDFLNYVDEKNNPEGLSNLELLAKNSIDTIDHSNTTGLLYFETKTGEGKSIVSGMEVGYRYIEYWIVRDKDDIPFAITKYSNYGTDYTQSLKTFIVGTDPTTLRRQGIYPAIGEAVRYMRNLGRCTIIAPSSYTDGDYISRLIDIEITYMKE